MKRKQMQGFSVGLCCVLMMLVLADASLMSGCQNCTAIGCVDDSLIEVRSSTNSFADGSYEMSVEGDNLTGSCNFVLKDGAMVASSAKCSGSLTGVSSQANKWTYTLQGSPSTFKVVLKVDSQVKLEQTVEPTYQESQPNGAGCPPVCKNATVSLSLGG